MSRDGEVVSKPQEYIWIWILDYLFVDDAAQGTCYFCRIRVGEEALEFFLFLARTRWAGMGEVVSKPQEYLWIWILNWLFVDNVAQGTCYRSRIRVGEETFGFFCIFGEKIPWET